MEETPPIDMQIEMLNAQVFWGIDLSGHDLTEALINDWENYYAIQLGIDPSKSDYADKRKAAVDDSQCLFLYRGLPGNYTYHVAIDDSLFTSEDDGITMLSSCVEHPQWTINLKRFCQVLNIAWSEPRWYLAAYAE